MKTAVLRDGGFFFFDIHTYVLHIFRVAVKW